MATAEELVTDARSRMDKSVEHARNEFSTVRTGRASAALLDRITIDYYGTPTPLNQMASVAVPEPQLLTVQPWDISQVNAVEKAIIAANLGMNPSNDGKIIRLPVPALNEERRKQLAKQVHEIAEEHKVAVRNIRHAANDALKKMLKDKVVSEDEERSGLDEVQKLTNSYVSKLDELARHKEQDIMSV